VNFDPSAFDMTAVAVELEHELDIWIQMTAPQYLEPSPQYRYDDDAEHWPYEPHCPFEQVRVWVPGGQYPGMLQDEF